VELELGQSSISPPLRASPARSTSRIVLDQARSYLELGKIRLSSLVVITAGVGFVLGAETVVEWGRLLLTLIGVGLAAIGANALNEWVEIARDARMRRTRGRPLPQGRLSPGQALAFGCLTGVLGPLCLAVCVNVQAAALSLATLLIYVLLYTPLKVRTPANTLVGAVVGALPPVIGWSAATGGIGAGGWILAGILFIWQIPHFLALAWLYRDDYARGGFRMLPSVDPHGSLTGVLVVVYCLALVPLTVALTLVGVTGWWYGAGAVALGVSLLALSIRLERERSDRAARRLFLASVIYLPLLLGLSVADRQMRSASQDDTRSAAAEVAGATSDAEGNAVGRA
jgi:heme o synthase